MQYCTDSQELVTVYFSSSKSKTEERRNSRGSSLLLSLGQPEHEISQVLPRGLPMWIAVIAIALALTFCAVYFIGHVLFAILKRITSLETFAQLHGRVQ